MQASMEPSDVTMPHDTRHRSSDLHQRLLQLSNASIYTSYAYYACSIVFVLVSPVLFAYGSVNWTPSIGVGIAIFLWVPPAIGACLNYLSAQVGLDIKTRQGHFQHLDSSHAHRLPHLSARVWHAMLWAILGIVTTPVAAMSLPLLYDALGNHIPKLPPNPDIGDLTPVGMLLVLLYFFATWSLAGFVAQVVILSLMMSKVKSGTKQHKSGWGAEEGAATTQTLLA